MRTRHRLGRSTACLIGTALLALTAACGTTAATANGAGAAVKVWALEDPQNAPLIQAGIDQFNKATSAHAALSTYSNDWYNLKLATSLGALNSPDVFFNWGGGSLAQYVKDGNVADLSSAVAKKHGFADAFMPSVLQVGKINGKQYALPINGIQPVVLFYNKAVFAQAGLQPPKTYDDMLALVDAFKARGIVPFALPGTQTWTELMWLEYLLDRIGGPDKFAAIAAGKDGAWSDPAVLRALQLCQDLAKRGAFGDSFPSTTYDPAGAPRLLATGKAAMFLMGTWEYSSQLSNNPDFVSSGNLGWTAFPTVPGGSGDPANVVGNPSNYFSVRSGGAHTEEAIDFLLRTVTSDAYVNAMIKSGQVPAVKGVETKLSGTANAQFTTFTYSLVAKAPSFTQSWDQALSSTVSTALLSNLQKLFLSQITPEQYVSAMQSVR